MSAAASEGIPKDPTPNIEVSPIEKGSDAPAEPVKLSEPSTPIRSSVQFDTCITPKPSKSPIDDHGKDYEPPKCPGEATTVSSEKIFIADQSLFISSPAKIVSAPKTPLTSPNPRSARRPVVTTPRSAKSLASFSEAELKNALRSLIRRNKEPSKSMESALIDYAGCEMERAATSHMYDDAIRINEAIEKLMASAGKSSIKTEQTQAQKGIEGRLQKAKESLKETIQIWEERITNQKQKNEMLSKHIKQNQKEEIEKFEKKWESPEFVSSFEKPSAQLIKLKCVEEDLAMTRQFERAKIVKRDADELQKQESKEARRRALQAMKMEFQTIEGKHAKEVECHKQYCESSIIRLEQEREKDIRSHELIVKRLEESSESSKVKGGSKGEFSIFTPRLAKRKSDRNGIRSVPILNIGGLNVKQIIHGSKPVDTKNRTE